MSSTQRQSRREVTYLKYKDIDLPNKKLAWIMMVIPRALIIIGIIAFFIFTLWRIVHPDYYGYGYPYEQSSFEPLNWNVWQAGTVCGVFVLAGIAILRTPAAHLYKEYYRAVWRGRVVDKTSEGGGLGNVGWYIVVEGYTYANERRRYTWSVSYGTFEQYKVGDRFKWD